MENLLQYLKKTENLFNWHLHEFHTANKSERTVQRLQMKAEEKELSNAHFDHKWPLKLTLSYELYGENPKEAVQIAGEVVDEVEKCDSGLTLKYKAAYVHIAAATKAFMHVKNRLGDAKELRKCLKCIKPLNTMTDEEMSAVFAMKAQIWRYYGVEGTFKGGPSLRQAIKLNPKEVEWKLSLVESMHHKRNLFRGHDNTWKDIEEPVKIIFDILNDEVTTDQAVWCKYLLAAAYNNYVEGKKMTPDVAKVKSKVVDLCKDIHEQTKCPQVIAFCAERFFKSKKQPEQQKGLEIIEATLRKFPNHVGVFTSASKIFKHRGFQEGPEFLEKAIKYGETAVKLGGYSSAWIVLQCRTALGKEFEDDHFFEQLLEKFPPMFKKRTYLNASMYYFFVQRNVVKGAKNFENAMEEYVVDSLGKPIYVPWAGTKVCSIEIAYNQIAIALSSSQTSDVSLTLQGVKKKIEKVTNVSGFSTTENLVEKMFLVRVYPNKSERKTIS